MCLYGSFPVFFPFFRNVCYELWLLLWSQVLTGLQLDLCLVSISSLPAANCSCLSAFVRTNCSTIPEHLAIDYILCPQICSAYPVHFQGTSRGGGSQRFTRRVAQIARSWCQDDSPNRRFCPTKAVWWGTHWLAWHFLIFRWQKAWEAATLTTHCSSGHCDPCEECQESGPKARSLSQSCGMWEWEGHGQGAKPEEGHGPGCWLQPFSWAIVWGRRQDSKGSLSREKP